MSNCITTDAVLVLDAEHFETENLMALIDASPESAQNAWGDMDLAARCRLCGLTGPCMDAYTREALADWCDRRHIAAWYLVGAVRRITDDEADEWGCSRRSLEWTIGAGASSHTNRSLRACLNMLQHFTKPQSGHVLSPRFTVWDEGGQDIEYLCDFTAGQLVTTRVTTRVA